MPPKKTATRATRRPAAPKAPADTRLRVRMYRHGLGDCFLLTFRNGPKPAHVLIDCGVLRTSGTVTMPQVVADIAQQTDHHLHLLVVTHEHADHVSGFKTERAAFDGITVDHVWAAWTEDTTDQQAKDLQKYKGDLLQALRLAAQAFARAGGDDGDGAAVQALLSFYDVPLGASGFSTNIDEAMDYVTKGAHGGRTEFLEPGQALEPAWLPGIRVHVLGPPRDATLIKQLGMEHGNPELYDLAAPAALAATARFVAAGGAWRGYAAGLSADDREALEAVLPFDPRYRMEESDARARIALARYRDPQAAWRTIDSAWAAGTSDLALQLDSLTNNTSLVLAFELVADGRVLLFSGDAQLGNWLSWKPLTWAVTSAKGRHGVVTTADLLSRTVFYKVGHHGSHNATPKDAGLELMTNPDLTAFIPVDKVRAAGLGWEMPAPMLYKRLLERTSGRTLRSDTGWPADGDRPRSIAPPQWASARRSPTIAVSDLAIDFTLP